MSKLPQMSQIAKQLFATYKTMISSKVDKTSIGSQNGVASLNAQGKVPVAQLPVFTHYEQITLNNGDDKIYNLSTLYNAAVTQLTNVEMVVQVMVKDEYVDSPTQGMYVDAIALVSWGISEDRKTLKINNSSGQNLTLRVFAQYIKR